MSDTNILTEKRDFFKRIFNLYRSKGSEYSFDLFFKSFFNVQDLDFYRPKTDLLNHHQEILEERKHLELLPVILMINLSQEL